MKMIAIIYNSMLLVAIGTAAVQAGLLGHTLSAALGLLALSIVSIVALYKSESWLSMYCERKAARERSRIADIAREINLGVRH